MLGNSRERGSYHAVSILRFWGQDGLLRSDSYDHGLPFRAFINTGSTLLTSFKTIYGYHDDHSDVNIYRK